MSEPEDKAEGDRADEARVQAAKAAARASIGKLIGDDAEVRKGRVGKRAADEAADTKSTEQE